MRVETMVPLDDWRAAGPAAEAAEAAGFDGITSSEIAHDPFIPLAFAALATRRVRLGTAIAVAFPRSPMITANLAWDLQAQSGGRFALGLGPQVRAHNERRFSVPWTAPVPRLEEYVGALRAIWRAWERREPLRYEGQHYRFTLMTPEFSPAPTGLPAVPIFVSAVGPGMLRMAGRTCDGVLLHGFCTRRYLEEVALPEVEKGLARADRDRKDFEVWGGGFIATGRDDAEVAKQLEWSRYRIAFYGSTPAYAGVLSLHGWDDLHAKLHRMSREGRWNEMAREVPDEVVQSFAAVAPWSGLRRAVAERFGGLVDSIALGFGEDVPQGQIREVLQDLKSIPSPCAATTARS
jgi:probable F420-dependent oxidoreductase